MNRFFSAIAIIVSLVSCTKETYKMPNYFKHQENGNVKEISIQTFQVYPQGLSLVPDNWSIIFPESTNETRCYNEQGYLTKDAWYGYDYDESGRLAMLLKRTGPETIVYDEKDNITGYANLKVQCDDEGQIVKLTEVRPADVRYGFPESIREYEYFPNGKFKQFIVDGGKMVYGSEYSANGDLVRHVQMRDRGYVVEYTIEYTDRDDHQNWKTRVITGSDGTTYLQNRTLSYYQ